MNAFIAHRFGPYVSTVWCPYMLAFFSFLLWKQTMPENWCVFVSLILKGDLWLLIHSTNSIADLQNLLHVCSTVGNIIRIIMFMLDYCTYVWSLLDLPLWFSSAGNSLWLPERIRGRNSKHTLGIFLKISWESLASTELADACQHTPLNHWQKCSIIFQYMSACIFRKMKAGYLIYLLVLNGCASSGSQLSAREIMQEPHA